MDEILILVIFIPSNLIFLIAIVVSGMQFANIDQIVQNAKTTKIDPNLEYLLILKCKSKIFS
jgi:hypothetical protein